MTLEEKNTLLHMLKNHIQYNANGWVLNIEAIDFDLKSECSSLEEYKQSLNYYMYKLLREDI